LFFRSITWSVFLFILKKKNIFFFFFFEVKHAGSLMSHFNTLLEIQKAILKSVVISLSFFYN
jgi:ribosomal protein S6